MMQTDPQFILHKSETGFGDFLQGMTYLWSTQDRLDQVSSRKPRYFCL